MPLLETKNLSLSFDGKQILNNLNLSFEAGKIYAIVGPNGAGKSTLSAVLMGLNDYREIEGDILFQGKSIRQDTVDQRAQKGITLAWQEPARYEGLTVKEFVRAGALEQSGTNIEQALHMVGLDPSRYLSRAVDKTLSGGERKKLELASILVMQPTVVLLDEPDSGIDVDSLSKIFEAIQIFKKQKTTVILITHSLTVLQQAEYAFLMCCGEIIDQGSGEKINPYFENKCLLCPHKNAPDLDGV